MTTREMHADGIPAPAQDADDVPAPPVFVVYQVGTQWRKPDDPIYIDPPSGVRKQNLIPIYGHTDTIHHPKEQIGMENGNEKSICLRFVDFLMGLKQASTKEEIDEAIGVLEEFGFGLSGLEMVFAASYMLQDESTDKCHISSLKTHYNKYNRSNWIASGLERWVYYCLLDGREYVHMSTNKTLPGLWEEGRSTKIADEDVLRILATGDEKIQKYMDECRAAAAKTKMEADQGESDLEEGRISFVPVNGNVFGLLETGEEGIEGGPEQVQRDDDELMAKRRKLDSA